MNSLPFISHHLFVAAIGNEDRVREIPTRRERLSVVAADLANAMALEVMDDLNPLPASAARPLPPFVDQTRR
jgi:hypothetical protein